MKKTFFIIIMALFAQMVQADDALEVSQAQVRLLPPGVPTTSGYLTITNHSDKTRYLVGASSSIAEKVELHNHVMADGMMKMEHQQQVELAAGQTITFQPGGLHLMFFGVSGPLKEQQWVDIRLVLKDGEELAFKAQVKAAEMQHHNHH